MRPRIWVSSIDTSTSSAPPRNREASVAALAYAPARYSPTCPPTYTGARSAAPRPRPTMPPDHACSVNSVAGRSHHGPSRPNGVIDVTVRCGCADRIAGGVNTTLSATLEPRDHTTASASASSALTKSRSDSGSATTLCFEHARKLNRAPSSPGLISAPDADHRRSGSPSGGSTLMTEAPASASSLVQYAPAIPTDRSTTV